MGLENIAHAYKQAGVRVHYLLCEVLSNPLHQDLFLTVERYCRV